MHLLQGLQRLREELVRADVILSATKQAELGTDPRTKQSMLHCVHYSYMLFGALAASATACNVYRGCQSGGRAFLQVQGDSVGVNRSHAGSVWFVCRKGFAKPLLW